LRPLRIAKIVGICNRTVALGVPHLWSCPTARI
jgi:hypothetical protein